MSRSFIRSLRITSLFFTLSLAANAQDYGLPELMGVPASNGDLIYGADDRVEVDEYPEVNFIEKAQSVALRVSKRRLNTDRNDPNRILFPNIILQNSMPQICSDERFVDQVSLGSCSGFLVNSTTLVTAGHCMVNERECADNRWIFGFKDQVTELHADQVYSCKKIVSQRYVYTKKEISDYAVIELDRPVKNYKPLKTRKFGRVRLNTPLIVIGHPLGLPMKATDGAVVSRMNKVERETPLRSFILRANYFTANLDAYGGNSGSPVFNKRTGKVEGILIQGAEDFSFNEERGCLESNHLPDSHLETYEKVMRINKIPGI